MTRNNPVRIVSPRVGDFQKPEPGGGDSTPDFLLSGEELLSRSVALLDQTGAIESTLHRREAIKNFIPAVVRIKTKRSAIAKTHRVEVEGLFNTQQTRNVVGLVGDYDLLLKIDSARDVRMLRQKIADIQKYDVAVSAVISLDMFEPQTALPKNTKETLKVKLHNFQDAELNKTSLEYFVKTCKELKVKAKISHYTDEITVCALDGWDTKKVRALVDTGAVYSVTSMPLYDTQSVELSSIDMPLPILQPIADTEYPTVGILDSGIERIPHLAPWIHTDNHASYPDEYVNREHGTFVAGRAVYPDSLHGIPLVGVSGLKVYDAIVFPKGGYVSEVELIDNIREAIESAPWVRVWSMSISIKRECDLDAFSDLGIFLDQLQKEYPIVIVKSAGNSKKFMEGAPRGRISVSADSVLSLVVGSIAHEAQPNDLALPYHASPFSPTGLGPAGIVKPDLVQLGGNAYMDGETLKINGVPSFGIDGSIIQNIGTSFATPTVAALIANLDHKVEDANPTLLRALAIHNGAYPQSLTYSEEERMRLLGFGVPKTVDEILYNDDDEITLILQDSLANGEWWHILDFPFPRCLVRDGKFYGEITTTLVTNPVLDTTQGIEYCQTNIDVFLGTYDTKIVHPIDGRHRNPLGRSGGKNLLAKAHYGTSKRNRSRSERYLLTQQKWQPTKKWETDLSLFVPSSQLAYLGEAKKWYLKLEALYRANTEYIYGRPEVEFCLIISIRDPQKQGKVYNETVTLLEQYNFQHSGIKLRSDVRISVRG